MSDAESASKKSKEVVVEIDRGGKGNDDPGSDASVERIAETVARLQSEKDELMHTMIRRQADFENYRKRIER